MSQVILDLAEAGALVTLPTPHCIQFYIKTEAIGVIHRLHLFPYLR